MTGSAIRGMWYQVRIIGLPGAGKSTVGPVLAERLGWRFIDIDAEIERTTGRPVPDIIRQDGEAVFREYEHQLTAALSSQAELVVAPGGGWAAQPGALDSLPDGVAVVWLRVTPEEAMRRLGGNPVDRPLLDGEDPLGRLRQLGEQRAKYYERADLVVDVDGRSVEVISGMIKEWLERNIS